MKRQIFLFVITIFFLFGCEKGADNLWTITGTVKVSDSQVPTIKSPLEDVKVYLMSAPVMMDTLKNWFDREIILDSAMTDTEGHYEFLNLMPADYVVMAVDSSMGYQFDWSESPDSIWTKSDNQQNEYIINFITPEPEEENLFGPYFSFIFHNYNRNEKYHRILPFRTAREKFGCGFLGLSSCNWYWKQQFSIGGAVLASVIENQETNSSKGLVLKNGNKEKLASEQLDEVYIRFEQDASGFFTDYKDEFHFKFYYDLNRLYTLNISGEELLDENVFNVHWFDDHVEITRIR